MVSRPFFHITLEFHQVHIPGQISVRQECYRIVHTGYLGCFVHSLGFDSLGMLDNGFSDLPGERLVRVSRYHEFFPYPLFRNLFLGLHPFVHVCAPCANRLYAASIRRIRRSVRSTVLPQASISWLRSCSACC